MTRELNEATYKKIIDTLRERSLTWGGLKEATSIPDKTLDRALKKLVNWGLAKKDEKGYWNWFEGIKVYETEHEFNQALQHSTNLLESLQGMFEWSALNPGQNFNFVGMKAIENELLRAMVAAHVKTGYPQLQAIIEDYGVLITGRNLLLEEVRRVASSFKIDNIEKPDSIDDVLYNLHFVQSPAKKWVIPKEHRNNVERLFKKIPPDKISQISQVENQRTRQVIQMAKEVQGIVLDVKNNPPIRGFCSRCPKSKVRSTEDEKPDKKAPEELKAELINMRNSYKAKGYPDTKLSPLNKAVRNLEDFGKN